MYNQIIVLGVIISIFFTELTGLSPAGLIVPGYIVLCLRTPQRVFYTLLVAFLAWATSRVLNNFLILYGRRRFAMMIILSFFIDLLLGNFVTKIPVPSMIGILVPGIIASEFEKQGILRSLISLGIVVGLIVLIMLLCGIPIIGI
ncbi:MAG: poly-gamma-glutamate biosynthesis protein PgsC [Tissierellaceae bacterium]|nr:poly-gamma-glutamate biosynthesis protein PgsC [Tissierellaceae bacterium]